MSLTPGTRIGPYEVAAQIGVGGMGEVYRAVDSNLGRSVAIKVLPDIFSQDPDRLARFEREAKTLASLNHPNIAQVFGLEKGASESGRQTQALVMELVEGPTLADRIAEGPIALDEAVPIAIQIAEALETAHDQGIVHRDLKPANVKVRADGTVKVLDFGLAKAMAPAGEVQSGTLANSPTITSPAMTQAGVVLGTAAYMSPEQAKGRAVDRRADIWSFGCVLFEMLTAKRAFAGDDISDVLVAILRDEPPWPALPATTPPHIRALLRRCLQKDPKKRLPHIGVARLELAEGGQGEVVVAPAARSVGNRMIAPIAWALAGAAVAGGAWFALRPPPRTGDAPAVVRFEITPPQDYRFTGSNAAPRFAVSPDGVSVVYQMAQSGKGSQLWLRRLDALESRPIPNTEATGSGEEAQGQFWSPDGRYIAFFDGTAQKLKKIDLQSGLLQILCDVPRNQYAGSWNADGVLIMSTAATDGVRRVSASGGPVTQVTTLDKASRETSHLWPEFLPDGRHFIYLASRSGDQTDLAASAVFVAALDGGAPKRLVDSAFMARFAPPNQLVYVRDGSLVAQRFDLDRLELAGEPVLVANSILGTTAGRAAVSLSSTGVLVYASQNAAEDNFDAVWFDRSGREISGSAMPRGVSQGVRLSPDGKLLAFTRGAAAGVARGGAIWIYDTIRQVETRLTTDMAVTVPVFSPDGLRVAFSREAANGAVTVHQQPVSGADVGQSVLRSNPGTLNVPSDWSSDGRLLVYSERAAPGPRVWFLPLVGDRKPFLFLEGGGASLSPDSRWLAYTYGGVQRQVFVQTFPDATAGRWPVSGQGGSHARWRRDGREIFFIDGQQLWSVSVRADPKLQVGEPTPLFEIPGGAFDFAPTIYNYDASPDGQRFVVLRSRAAANSAALTVVVNWMAALEGGR